MDMSTFFVSLFCKILCENEMTCFMLFILANGGSVQPGCNLITNIGFCSHVAVMYLYAATLKTPMIACKCSMRTMDEIRFNACMEMCPSPVLMGVPTPHT